MEKLTVRLPVIVEGRYDKNKLSSVIDANIITTEGFGIFNSAEKRALLLKLAEKSKIIVLTDPDGAGLLIRSHLRGILPPERMINLYVPEKQGKEKRKKAPSKSGLLGVEGTEADKLRALFAPFADDGSPEPGAGLTKADFFADGLSGGPGSAALRAALARELGFPSNMSSGALLEAINTVCTLGKYRAAVLKIKTGEHSL